MSGRALGSWKVAKLEGARVGKLADIMEYELSEKGVARLEIVCNYSRVLFEYDDAKSRANAAKHGIDFEEVRKMWDGIVVAAPAKFVGEDRLLAIGQIDGKFWTAIITERGPALRIISARRSRQNEIKIYQDHGNQP